MVSGVGHRQPPAFFNEHPQLRGTGLDFDSFDVYNSGLSSDLFDVNNSGIKFNNDPITSGADAQYIEFYKLFNRCPAGFDLVAESG
ncbi:hypothetical protein CYMTET_40037 [Cymbomonas tetramitiformis]|uniref:Uncharacterized protein n=1 Tax=Cymbomonas tetramitiformis TaxID=36881 RepID=A0AAE0C8V1_9CHLO|nr:hypothetical protein CYMTET_40037 [Cymbomonas tetramitiformis]